MERRSLLTIIAIINLLHIHQHTAAKPPKCEHIMIASNPYRRYLIATIDGFPTDLSYDPRNGNIYFMLNKRNDTKGLHILRHGSLNIKKIGIPPELKGQCLAVDVANKAIYIGTNQGVVMYDHVRNEVNSDKIIGEEDVKTIYLDYNNHMYLISGSLHEVYKINNGTVNMNRLDRISKAYNLVIDRKGNMFYEYIDGKMYFFSVDLFEPVQYRGFIRDFRHILDITKDDDAIVCVRGFLFRLKTNNVIPEKVCNLGFVVTALKFLDNGDILVGTKGKIFRYKMIRDSDPCPAEDYLY